MDGVRRALGGTTGLWGVSYVLIRAEPEVGLAVAGALSAVPD